MIAEGGHAALWLAAGFALLSAAGARRPALAEFAAPGLSIAALLTACAALALLWSTLAADFSLVLVDDRVHRLQPDAARIASVLRSPGGWLLAAATATGLAALATALLGSPMRAVGWSLAALLAATLAFDPFVRQPFVPVEGRQLWVPVDATAALLAPLLLAVAAAVAAVALGRRPPPLSRGFGLASIGAAALAVVAGGSARALQVEAVIAATAGAHADLGGLSATVVALVPTAGPGFTAIEAELVVGGATLHPQWRTNVVSGGATVAGDAARVAGGRVEAVPTSRGLRLIWRPLA